MARRKTKKRHHSRRRRVSGLGAGSDVLMKVVGLAAGAAAGAIAANTLAKAVPSMAKFAPIAAVGVGVLLPRFVKSNLGQAAGAGMIAIGAAQLISRNVMPLPGIAGIGYNRPYGQLRSQRSVGAPGFSNKVIGSVSDSAVIGSLSEN